MQVACPWCWKEFPQAGDSLAVHLSTCSLGGDPDGTPDYKSCSICLKLFGLNTPANEILFHKEECERINGAPPKRPGPQKRRRGSDTDKHSSYVRVTTPSVMPQESLPQAPETTSTECFSCGMAGRQLLVCTGTCSRSFHVGCVSEPATLIQRQALSARKQWKCAECSRSIHTCFVCGFLGDDGVDLFPCVYNGCGLYCHDRCAKVDNMATFICPRHTCNRCNQPMVATAEAIFCYRCTKSCHKNCNTAAGSKLFANPVGHFGDCGGHQSETPPSHLKSKLAVGDIVLVLEFNNKVLSVRARSFNGNQWGRITKVESIAEWGPQLLDVELFACGNIISLGSNYVLHMECLKECMISHFHAELSVRDPTGTGLTMTHRTDAAMDTCLAFQNWGRQLKMTSSQMIDITHHGFLTWTKERAPFDFLDTRRRANSFKSKSKASS
ncbi:unnamed protein product [Aphanomyces euteiches]